jgi:cytochrome c oxidase subunit 4
MVQEQHDSHGGGISLYLILFVVLGVITYGEWAIFEFREQWGISNPVLVGSLGIMSLVKFFIVVGWYMHLKYDPKMIKNTFLFSFLLVCGVMVGLLVLMAHHG